MTWTIDIENIGGIRRGSATIDPGVNAVRASNWQGKSSFLSAIKTGFGVGKPLTEGTDRGKVELSSPDETATVTLHRDGRTVTREGTPLLETDFDRVRVELFGALDETNPVRKAVRDGENLEAILTQPLDIEDIDAVIAETKRRRKAVETELERAEDAANRIPSVRQQVSELETTYESLSEKREALSNDGTTVDSREELTQLRSERDRVVDRVERLSSTIDRIDDELDSKRTELEGVDVADDDSLTEELSTLQDEFESIKQKADLAQELYTANRRFFEADIQLSDETVQHDLLADTIDCWVCGQRTERSAIEQQLDVFKSTVRELQNDVRSHEDRIADLESKREEIENQRRRKQDLESTIADLEQRRAERKESLEAARERRDDIEEQIANLEDLVDDDTNRLTDIESEMKYTKAEIDSLREELDTLETEANRRSELKQEREELDDKIEELRTRKDRVRRETRESFKRHMTDLIEKFDTGFEAARLTDSFDLVVARDGHEANLDALSQGERELLGIVAGIAGYEAFDVASVVPMLLLDNLGVLTDRNVEILVDHLRERTAYLVFTSYPEHTAFAGNEIDVSDWNVVSGDQSVDTGM